MVNWTATIYKCTQWFVNVIYKISNQLGQLWRIIIPATAWASCCPMVSTSLPMANCLNLAQSIQPRTEHWIINKVTNKIQN